MQCPDCGGPMWDNRQTKKTAKQPDYKCKDKEQCGKAVWEKPKADNGTPATTAPRGSRPLAPLYYSCMKAASATVQKLLGDKATPADVIAATATIFIAAANLGAPVMTPKPAPPPPPPPPPPKPEPEPVYDEYVDEDLPF